MKEKNKVTKKKQKSKKDEPVIKSKEFILPGFTREGLIHGFTTVRQVPTGIYFEAEEFEVFLQKMTQDYNSGLSSFITKLYDCAHISNDFTKTNFLNNQSTHTVINPLLSIMGVSNEKSYFDNLPKNYAHTGYYARFSHFMGTARKKIIPKPGKLDPSIFNLLKSILNLINSEAQKLINQKRVFDFKFEGKVDELWSIKYLELKDIMNSDPSNIANPSIDRDYKSIFKIAAIFELVIRAHQIVRYGDAKETLFGDTKISKEAYLMAAEWVDYLVGVDLYLFKCFLDKKSQSTETLPLKAINLLMKFPDGMLKSDLKRHLNLHRSPKQTKLFDSLMQELRDEGNIVIKSHGRGYVIKLKEHLLMARASTNDL